ncbi:hypothetical protein B7463_g10993, partial [Scytalidium lignicola]
MPSSTKLVVKPLHPTFIAEVTGVDWTKPIDAESFRQIDEAIYKYGVLVFRDTGLDDKRQIAFSRLFGELDDMAPHVKLGRKLRLPDVEIFDVSNLNEDGEVVTESDRARLSLNKGNTLWHADLAFNSRRTGLSILRGHKIPPRGMGGETSYLDARTAYEDLSTEMKEKIEPLVANNSLVYNRKLGDPEFYEDIDPADFGFSRHKIAVPHPQSGRKTLYLTTYCHHFDGMTQEESQLIINELFKHATQDKYVMKIEWENDSDLVMWDNTAVLHKASAGGAYLTTHPRDMRRTSVFDAGPYGHGENDPTAPFRQGINNLKVKSGGGMAQDRDPVSVVQAAAMAPSI